MVKNGESFIQFLKDIFNANLRGDISYRKDRSIKHAEVTKGIQY